ncbi:xyloside xylosyltransferase 1 [Protopterus annectens]|uniref:xyloside xylosyltransferase 1 n=1 Tax=Protopterus annectens TaxID=7888 RepID=UPI001CF9A4B4|nr:xyloside xylosyltransferase 1 [Protopterus annectens]
MDLLHIMARISTFKLYQIVILLCAALAVFIFYYFGSERENFTSTTKRIKENRAIQQAEGDARFSVEIKDASLKSYVISSVEQEAKNITKKGVAYHILMMFTKVDKNWGLQEKFKAAMTSMTKYCRLDDNEVLHLHFVSDSRSKEYCESILDGLLHGALFKYKITFHDVNALTEKLAPIVEAMQKHFSSGSGTYYSDSIFFLSVAMHRIMPSEISRIVQLDLDVKYRTNIRELFEEFDKFPSGAVLGIAREMQPVYRYVE